MFHHKPRPRCDHHKSMFEADEFFPLRPNVKKNDSGNHIVSNCTVMLKPPTPSMIGVCLWFGTIKRAQVMVVSIPAETC